MRTRHRRLVPADAPGPRRGEVPDAVRAVAIGVLLLACRSDPPAPEQRPEHAAPTSPAEAPEIAAKPIDELVTSAPPAATDVARAIARGYAEPALLVVEPGDTRNDVTRWKRTFDGVEVLGGTITSHDAGGWHTRWKPELAGPERVRRGALIGEREARARAGVTGEVALVYRPDYGRRHVAGQPRGSAIHVVERYRLAYRIATAELRVFVDAYSSAVIERDARATD